MSVPGFHARSFAPVSGLGGVRALAGVGCGCQQQNASGMGVIMDVVKSPIFVGIALTLIVGAVILIRESGR